MVENNKLDNISEYFKYDELTDTKSITDDGNKNEMVSIYL